MWEADKVGRQHHKGGYVKEFEYFSRATKREPARSKEHKSPNLRRLESDFSGLDKDKDVRTVFNRLGNLIKVRGEDLDGQIRESGYMETGDIDYTIEAVYAHSDTKGLTASYYRVQAIYPSSLETDIEAARWGSRDIPEFQVQTKHLIENDPRVQHELRQLQMQYGKLVFKVIN